MRRILQFCLVAAMISTQFSADCRAQTAADETKSTGSADKHEFGRDLALSSAARNVLLDQKAIWTSPLRFRERDLNWILPLSFITAGSIATDTAVTSHLTSDPQFIRRSRDYSNYALAGMVGTAGGMYFFGSFTNNPHLKETGLLSGEALADSLLVTTALKSITRRERPTEGTGAGRFWQSGTSFPSDHAAASWAVATVIAHEYPGPLTKFFAYGTATSISAARVFGRKHFASDVLIGSGIGWYLGRQIYRAHTSDSEIDAADWGTFVKKEPEPRAPDLIGTTSVPMDSWVYDVFDRLGALGYIQTSFAGMRPWTRMECARLVQEASENIEGQGEDEETEIAESIHQLRQEFSRETRLLDGGINTEAAIESVYTRVGGIEGSPVTDGFHFGQTLINDYGRPFGQGVNAVSGLAARASAGPLAFYVRGEYQRGAAAEPVPPETQQLIGSSGDSPVAAMRPTTDRFRILEAYVSLNLHNWQFSFGKQDTWWGPGTGGALMLTNNAEPISMLRVTRVSPVKLPGILGHLGAIRSDTFLGRLQGHNFVRLAWPEFPLIGTLDRPLDPQPYIWGHKLSIHPTENLEFGVSIASVFAGFGRPLTLETFKHTFSSSGNAQPIDPGDRLTGFDFRYRVPGLRKWVLLYNESMSEDEPSPIAYPRRSAMNPGIYLPQVPKISKLDLRVEGVYTNLPGLIHMGYFYSNLHYQNGYTNSGQLMGSWIGRQAVGLQAWTRYWISSQNSIQLGFRRQTVDKSFLKGGNLQDFSATTRFQVSRAIQLTSSLQIERWNFPGLSQNPQHNFAASVQLTYRPPHFNLHASSSTRAK